MKVKEIYNSTELNKTIVESTTNSGFVITYYGVAEYPHPGESETGFRGQADFNSPIWRIRRSIYNPYRDEYTYSYPDGNVGYCYKWSDRASLNYDGQPTFVVYIVLENEDNISTETGDVIITG